MELDIDYAVKSKYADFHFYYAQNLKIFKSVLRVLESFFKKEKYLNSEVKPDENSKNKATIRFCAQDYDIALQLNPACPDTASLLFSKPGGEKSLPIGEIQIDAAGNVIFPGNRVIALRDDYDFNNAVLKSFFTFLAAPQTGNTSSR